MARFFRFNWVRDSILSNKNRLRFVNKNLCEKRDGILLFTIEFDLS